MRAAELDGGAGERSERLSHAGRELFLSMQPKATPTQRKVFLADLPKLMQELTDGMNLIGWPDRRADVLRQLMPAHAEALKGRPCGTLDCQPDGAPGGRRAAACAAVADEVPPRAGAPAGADRRRSRRRCSAPTRPSASVSSTKPRSTGRPRSTSTCGGPSPPPPRRPCPTLPGLPRRRALSSRPGRRAGRAGADRLRLPMHIDGSGEGAAGARQRRAQLLPVHARRAPQADHVADAAHARAAVRDRAVAAPTEQVTCSSAPRAGAPPAALGAVLRNARA